MENYKSPWSLTPEEEAAVLKAREEAKESEKITKSLETITSDLDAQIDEFIARKHLIVKKKLVENGFVIVNAENNTFERLGNKIEELIAYINQMLDSQNIPAYFCFRPVS